MEAGLVAHLEHTHQPRGIRQYIVEAELGCTYTHVEKLVQLGLGLLMSAHQGEKSLQIVLHVPVEDVGIVLCEVSPPVVHGVERFHPFALIVLGPHHALIRAEDVAIELRTFHKQFLVLRPSQHLGNLSNTPVGIAVHGGQRNALAALPVGIHLWNGFWLSGS